MMVVVVRDGAMFEVLCLNCSDRSPGVRVITCFAVLQVLMET